MTQCQQSMKSLKKDVPFRGKRQDEEHPQVDHDHERDLEHKLSEHKLLEVEGTIDHNEYELDQ